MDYIIEKELKDEIFTDEYEYFFSFLTDRFEYATELWTKELEKKFNKKFKPIYILSAKQNEFFKKENFIIINKKLQEIKQSIKKDNIIYLEDYEDTNKEFSESEFIKNLIDKLVKKQDRVFILGFTSACLELINPNTIILGPNPTIVSKLDNKITHTKLFHWLKVPKNNTRIYSTIEEIKQKENYPFYISAAYTSGGHESGTIYKEEDLDIFFAKIRQLNKKEGFIVADLIQDIKLSPNITAIICEKNDTRIISITDQILRGNQYLGNIYPSNANERETITKATKTIGDYLSSLGFRGLFGLDFIITSNGKIFTVDLNPRRQGGYLCNILMALQKINIPEIELKLALGEKVPDFKYEDFQVDYCWAHSKIKPYIKNVKILNTFQTNSPDLPFKKVGEEYSTIFYPQEEIFTDGNAGYLIISDNNYQEIKEKIIKETEMFISKSFEIYQ